MLRILVCLSALLTFLLVSAAARADLTLAENGHTPYVILLPADASAPDTRGAREIQNFVKQMSGADLPILPETDPLPAHAILIGNSKHLDTLGIKLDPALGVEGFVLKTVGDRIVIAGPGPRGTMYGCTTFLEKLGVRFLTPTVTRFPKQATITVPVIDDTESPAFEYREPFFTEAFDKDWAARLKMNGARQKLDETTGGHVVYYPFVHTLETLVPPNLFATHPEYFPLVGGKRVNGYEQRCLSNPDVLKMTIDNVKKWMTEHPEAMLYSVSQNDADGWCDCDNCKAIQAKYGGGRSGLMIWFVNQVAESVEKEYPGKLIDTLAYMQTEKAPTGIAPRPNVRVRLCPIQVCQSHPYETDTAPPTVSFMKTLGDWGKLSPTLYIWHYNTDFIHYLMPFPDFAEFPADIRLYKHSGVKGIFFEGAYGEGGGGSDAELRSYVMAKQLWDEKADTNTLVTEWMAGVYGPAAKPMRAWFDLLQSKASDPKVHLYCYSSPKDVSFLGDDVLAQGDQLYDEAAKLAANDPVATEYITKSRLCLQYVKLVQHPSIGDDFKQFLATMHKFGIKQISEGQSTDAWEAQYSKDHAKK